MRKWVECVWNVMAHAQKPDFFFRRNGRVHLNGRGRRFSRLLAAEMCASAVVILDTPCSEVVWRVLVTHSIRQFPLHFPSRASPCAIAFQLDSTAERHRSLCSNRCHPLDGEHLRRSEYSPSEWRHLSLRSCAVTSGTLVQLDNLYKSNLLPRWLQRSSSLII
jgi:hypothetical protein